MLSSGHNKFRYPIGNSSYHSKRYLIGDGLANGNSLNLTLQKPDSSHVLRAGVNQCKKLFAKKSTDGIAMN
jgi:hypothetical protein